MGVKVSRRLVAVALALVMIVCSAISVFAGEASSVQGSSNSNKTVSSVAKGTLTVKAEGTVKYRVGKSGKFKVAKNGVIKNLKKNAYVTVSTDDGKSYRWMTVTKTTKATTSKVSWKKVSGADYYAVKIVKKDGTKVWKKVNGTKISKKTLKKWGVKKGAKISIRAISKKYGHVYTGQLSKAVKIK